MQDTENGREERYCPQKTTGQTQEIVTSRKCPDFLDIFIPGFPSLGGHNIQIQFSRKLFLGSSPQHFPQTRKGSFSRNQQVFIQPPLLVWRKPLLLRCLQSSCREIFIMPAMPFVFNMCLHLCTTGQMPMDAQVTQYLFTVWFPVLALGSYYS